MLRFISKEYLLFVMDNKGRLPSSDITINFISICLFELYLKEFIKIENKNMYINKELSQDYMHLLPIYNVIKYNAAMKPKEIADFYLINHKYITDLFNSVKSSLIEENRTIEITTEGVLGKKKVYCISNPEEILKTVTNIKTMINNKVRIDKETIIFLELLSGSGLLEKYFSHEEFNYLKDESKNYENKFVHDNRQVFS